MANIFDLIFVATEGFLFYELIKALNKTYQAYEATIGLTSSTKLIGNVSGIGTLTKPCGNLSDLMTHKLTVSITDIKNGTLVFDDLGSCWRLEAEPLIYNNDNNAGGIGNLGGDYLNPGSACFDSYNILLWNQQANDCTGGKGAGIHRWKIINKQTGLHSTWLYPEILDYVNFIQ